MVDLVLAFDGGMRPLVEEFFEGSEMEEGEKGRFIVHAAMPEDGWLYGMILSYGPSVEVLAPEIVRSIVRDMAADVEALYKKK